MNEHRYNKGDVVYTRPGLNNSLGDDYAPVILIVMVEITTLYQMKLVRKE